MSPSVYTLGILVVACALYAWRLEARARGHVTTTTVDKEKELLYVLNTTHGLAGGDRGTIAVRRGGRRGRKRATGRSKSWV